MPRLLVGSGGFRTSRWSEEANQGYRQNFYCSEAAGREYGTWMTAGRVSTIADAGVTVGGTIASPIGVIESIIQDELITRQGYSDLDVKATGAAGTGSFDVAYDDRRGDTSNWGFDVSIDKQFSSFQLIDDLAKQCMSKIYFNSSKEIAIRAFNSSNSIQWYYKTDDKLTNLDQSLHRGRILGDVKLETVPLENVYSEVQVNYNYDYAKDSFIDNIYVTADAENWDTVALGDSQTYCNNAEDDYHINGRRYLFDAWAIESQACAEELCKLLIERLTRRLYICTFRTGLEGMNTEIGDFINIESELMESLFSSNMATQKWDVFKIRPMLGEKLYEIKAIQV